MTEAIATELPDGLPPSVRNRAMLALSLAAFLAVLETFIANNALPAISLQLGSTPSDTIWVANAYQVAMAVSLLPFSSLGDIGGYRRVYLFGLVVFTLASLACGLAGSLPVLVLARIAQGFGAAGIISVNIALVRFIYPRAKLGQGIGIVALAVGVAACAGPSVAAGLLALGPWQYLFLFIVPLGLLTLILAVRYVPATPGTGNPFDISSALLNAVGFGLMVVGADGLGHGRDPQVALAELGVGIVALVVFFRRQLSQTTPMMPVDLLRHRPFALAVATSICANACLTLAFISLPFYFIFAGGQSQVETGLLMTPWPAGLIFAAPIAGRLSDKYSVGVLCGSGLAMVTAGMLMLMRIAPTAHWESVVGPMLICGLGFGLFQTSNNRELMISAPPERSGAAAGMMTTARLIGQSIGGLVVAIAFAFAGSGRVEAAHGALSALGIGAGFAAAAMAISLGQLVRSTPKLA